MPEPLKLRYSERELYNDTDDDRVREVLERLGRYRARLDAAEQYRDGLLWDNDRLRADLDAARQRIEGLEEENERLAEDSVRHAAARVDAEERLDQVLRVAEKAKPRDAQDALLEIARIARSTDHPTERCPQCGRNWKAGHRGAIPWPCDHSWHDHPTD